MFRRMTEVDWSWTSANMGKLKWLNALFFLLLPSSSSSPLLPLYCTVNLFLKKNQPTPSSRDHGPSWQVSCVFCFATVWLWRIHSLKNCFQIALQITDWLQRRDFGWNLHCCPSLREAFGQKEPRVAEILCHVKHRGVYLTCFMNQFLLSSEKFEPLCINSRDVVWQQQKKKFLNKCWCAPSFKICTSEKKRVKSFHLMLSFMM